MKPKKSLGQNFLINPKIAERIAFEADISKKDTVLEIGSGTGNLTKYLLTQAKKVIAVEKDDNLIKELTKKFKKEVEEKKLILIKDDILKFDIQKMDYKFFSGPRVAPIKSEGLNQTSSKNFIPSLGNYKIIANIPYNITGAILKKFLSERNKPESMTLMVQKEVAERIMARDGKESILSISVKAYSEPKILFKVSRGNFYPSPKVDSAVIAIKNISRKIFIENNIDEDKFWEIIRAGFAHKRKKLSSNLKNFISSALRQDLENKRAEELTLKDWIDLAKML